MKCPKCDFADIPDDATFCPHCGAAIREGDLFFSDVVDSYVNNPRFIRRDWLAEEVKKLLADPDCRFVLLTAEPGAGKSAFMAQLAHDHPDCPRYFIRRDQRGPLADTGTQSFLLRLGFQLAALYPELFTPENLKIAVEQRLGTVEDKGKAIGAEIDKIVASPFYQQVIQIQQYVERIKGSVVGLQVKELLVEPRSLDPVNLQFMALIAPAKALLSSHPEKQIVILVDALDEIRYQFTEENIVKWLTNCPELPRNVKFILTSRPPEGALVTFLGKQQSNITSLKIDPEDQHVQDDITTYIQKLVGIKEVATTLKETEQGVEDFVKEAVNKADGNLGYLDALAKGIDQAQTLKDDLASLKELLSLKQLPENIQGLYAFFLHQIKSTVAEHSVKVKDPETGKMHLLEIWPEVYRPFLSVLAIAFEPLTLDQIKALSGSLADQDYIVQAKDRLLQFLDTVGNRYRLYHATLPEFLTATATKAHAETEDLYVDPYEWNRTIVAHYREAAPSWNEVSWVKVDDYGLRYLAAHLYALRHDPAYRTELYNLMCRSIMREKQVRTFSHAAFASDVDLAISATAEDDSNEGLVQLIRLCLLYATLGSSATEVPPELLGMLAQVGQSARAMDYARLIQDREKQSKAYAFIGEALLTQGEGVRKEAETSIRCALAATETIPDEWSRAQALSEVAKTLVHMGDLDRALAAAEKISGGSDKVQVLSRVARALGQAGYQEQAAVVANRALAVAEMIPEGGDKAQSLSKEEALREVAQILGRVGDSDRALAAAGKIPNEYGKAIALSDVAQALTQAGDQEKATEAANLALAAAENDPDEWSKGLSLGYAAQALAQVGHSDHALAVAEKIQDEDHKAHGLIRVAQALAELGEQNKAMEAANRALAVAETITNKLFREASLNQVAQALAQVGDPDRALAVAETILPGNVKSDALRGMAQALAQAEELDKALAVAEMIPDGSYKMQALNVIARTLVLVGDQNKSKETVNRALTVAETIPDEYLKWLSLSEVARALAQVGESDRALEVFERILYGSVRDKALIGKARALTQVGDLDRALAAAEEIPDGSDKVHALSGMAQALALMGDQNKATETANRALTVAETIPDEYWKALALGEVARTLAQVGDPYEATETANRALAATETIRDEWNKAKPLIKVAQALVQVGDLDRALTVTETIQDEYQKAMALSGVAQALAQVGDKQKAMETANQALAMAEKVQDLRQKVTALIEVSRTLAQVGDSERALALAETISDDWDKAAALSGVAQALAQVGEHDKSLQVGRLSFTKARMAGRVSVFHILIDQVDWLAALDKGATLWQVYEAMQEVDGWWGV